MLMEVLDFRNQGKLFHADTLHFSAKLLDCCFRDLRLKSFVKSVRNSMMPPKFPKQLYGLPNFTFFEDTNIFSLHRMELRFMWTLSRALSTTESK